MKKRDTTIKKNLSTPVILEMVSTRMTDLSVML